jgi:hypothetical protein
MFPRIGEGYWADTVSGKYQLRLFSELTALGWAAVVYDANSKKFLAREWADDLEDGKQKAEALAKKILKIVPKLEWKRSPNL